MGSNKRKRLDLLVATIQRRFGPTSLQQGERAFPLRTQVPYIPTGFPDLDTALDGIGGIPRGRLTEILSTKTAGAATLALKIMARAQAEGNLATYVELRATFDPDYAARCGVQLSRSQFLLVRPGTAPEALAIIQTLVANRSTGVLVFDTVTLAPANESGKVTTWLGQLPQALAQSNCAMIFLTSLESDNISLGSYPGDFAILPHYATIRILLRKERWLFRRNDIYGYQSRVMVLNNKLGKAGRTALISITFNGVVEGDGT